MGLFRRTPPEPETPMPIPRATRVWPKAMPAAAAKPVPAAPAVIAKPAPPRPAIVAKPAPPPATASSPSVVKPVEPPPPAAAREASSVVAAFASWKQVTAVKTAVAGKTETAPAGAPPGKPEGRREDPVMFVYRAAAKQVRGEHDAAIEDLTKAIEIDPTCTTAWAGRALSLEAKGDLAGARRDYAKSIEIELRQEIDRLARPL